MKTRMNMFAALVWVALVLTGTVALAQEGLDAPPAAVIAQPEPVPVVEATPAAAPLAEAGPVAVPEPAEAAAPSAPVESASEGGSTIELPTEDSGVAGAEITAADSGEGGKISITLDNVPLQDVVRMFTRISGANIVAGTNLVGNVTVNLQDVEWEPALRVILDSSGLALLEKTAGIYVIINKSDLASEPVASETIFLSYVTVSNMLPIVKAMITSTNGSATAFPGSNAIIIQETTPRIKAIKDVVLQVDRPREQVLIETKFVELNDQAIKDLGINWQVLQGYTVGVTPTYDYNKVKQTEDVSTDTRSDRSSSTGTDRSTRRRTLTERDVDQDAFANVTDAGAATDNTAITPGTGPTVFDNSFTLEETLSVSGENFSDFDAANKKITLIPRRDDTRVQESFAEDESVRTLDALFATGEEVTKITTEALGAIMSADQFALTLSALKQNGGVEIVSNPKVIVASGETATIHVGQNEPNIVAVPQGDTGDRYAYQLDEDTPFIEIGVKLFVTPVLNTESNISVKITPELSRKLEDKVTGDGRVTFPVTSIRKISTEFNLESGRTVAIGGLTQTEDSERVTKVPILGDIPIIGKYLFRHTHMEKEQDEVIIFVTVTSAKPGALAQISGIPEEGRLIHRHLARKAEEAAKAELDKSRRERRKAPSLK